MNIPHIDRFATLYFFYPLLQRLPFYRKNRIPILMYHSISDKKESGIHPYYRTNTSPAIFEKQMKFIYENNYSVISLSEAVNMLVSNKSGNYLSKGSSNHLQKKYVVITFDDGFRDSYSHAFPIMKKYNFTATIFLATSFIDKQREGFKGNEHLKWSDVQELHGNGIDFGSHTVNHPQLSLLGEEEIEYELKFSKEEIENKLGSTVESFSYPYKFPDEDRTFIRKLIDILKKCGYKYGVSTKIGSVLTKDNVCFMNRIPVNSCDDMALFNAKLKGGYDWVYKPQYLSKIIKKNIKQLRR